MQKLTYEDISGICSGLSMLIGSGTGSADALYMVAEDMEGTKLKPILRHMADGADTGLKLTEVFEQEGCFPQHLTALLAVGEKTGRTVDTLRSLSAYYDSRARMSRQIRDALIYPMILLIIMLVVVGVLLAYVLPIFNSVYEQLGGRLTGIAGGLFRLGQGISAIMPVLCVLLVLVTVFVIAFAVSDAFREKITAVWRRHMGAKGISWQVSSAHFVQAFSMGVSSGMDLEDAMELSGRLLGEVPGAKEKCDKAMQLLEKGTSVAEVLRQAELMPESECRLLSTAVRSGTTGSCLQDTAERMSDKSERAIAGLVGRIEPTLVIVGCLLVGLILFSVMMPLMNIMSSIG